MPRFPDPQWYDAMYNNRALVPDHASYLNRWADESARARRDSDCRLDLPYGDGAGETLDVFLAAQPDAPVLVFIHGVTGALWTRPTIPSSPRRSPPMAHVSCCQITRCVPERRSSP